MSNGKFSEREICEGAIAKWDFEKQIHMAIEEFAELIVELAKIKRKNNGTTEHRVIEELVDCEIMLTQMKIIFGADEQGKNLEEFCKIKREKLEKILHYLKND